ncbi:MAG: HlyD family secretion protein [Bacillota bacterium]|nr:HlyD family secretion protein [Bacillota bacterium]
MKKSVKWGALVVLGVLAAVSVASAAVQPLTAELIEVKPQTVAQVFKEEGIVEAAGDRLVYSPVGGEITRLAVQEGQKVAQGDLLVELSTKELEYQLAQLQAQLRSLAGQMEKSIQEIQQQVEEQQLALAETQRQLAKSREDYRRTKYLYEAGAATQVELLAAERAVEQLQNAAAQQESRLELLREQAGHRGQAAGQAAPALGSTGAGAARQYFQGQLEAVEAQISQLEYQIARSRITAPITGVVEELTAEEGMVIAPQVPLLKLAGDQGYEVNAYLLTEDVLPVKVGLKVTLIQKRRDGDYRFPGTVKAIAPAAVEKVSALGLSERRVKVTIRPEGKVPQLRPGYALDVEFSVLEQENKLAVPKTALFPYEGGDAVWVVRAGRARIQPVKKGLETTELVVIEAGLAAGDEVIKNPGLEGLKAGRRVRAGGRRG